MFDNAGITDTEATPEVRIIRIDAERIVQMVNWHDYRGWECRMASVPGATDAKFLGYVAQYEDRFGQSGWDTFTGPGGRLSGVKGRSFSTDYFAVRSLIIASI